MIVKRLVPSRGSIGEITLHLTALLVLFALAVEYLDFVIAGRVCLVIVFAYVIWHTVFAKQVSHPGSGTWHEFLLATILAASNLVLIGIMIFKFALVAMFLLVAIGAAVALDWLAKRHPSGRAARIRPEVEWALIGSLFVQAQLALGLASAAIAHVLLAYASTLFTPQFDFVSIVPVSYFQFEPIVVLPLLIAVVVFGFLALATFRMTPTDKWRAVLRDAWSSGLAGGLGQLFIAVPGGLALLGVVSTMASIASVAEIAETMNFSWGSEGLRLLFNVPWLAASLFGAAFALAALAGIVADGGRGRWRLSLVFLLLAVGAVATALGSAKGFRIAYVASLSGIPIIEPLLASDEAIRELARRSRGDGEQADALAARLNAKGHWSTEAPKDGLVVLVPELEKAYAAFDEIDCRLRISAAVLSEAERTAVAKLEGEGEAIAIKYCYRAVCRSHRVTEQESVTWLISSHDSKREGWAARITSDIVFETIANGGGFCTSAGELADGYQG